MQMLFLLVPFSVVLILCLVVVSGWRVLSVQFDELAKFAELAFDDATDC